MKPLSLHPIHIDFYTFIIVLYFVHHALSKCRGVSHSHLEGMCFLQISREPEISNKALKIFITHDMSKSNHWQTKNIVLGKFQLVYS